MATTPTSLASRDIASVFHPFTNTVDAEVHGPLVMDHGKGVWVYDDQGKGYIEGCAGLWCAALGFGEERLVRAATEQMRTLPFGHLFTWRTNNPAVDLAELLIKIAPVPMSKVFFANSGSEALDTVVKMVWYYSNALEKPERKKIISRVNAFHGSTVAAASLTGIFRNHRDFDLPIENIVHTDCPHYYRYGREGESEEAFSTRMAEQLEQTILREGPETVAAFVAEPIMGAGGVLMPPAGYFEKVQRVIAEYDLLFIADEVITGFGRTGNMFGSETFGLKPDIITMAKGLSSAYAPISAVMVNDKVFTVLSHNSEKIGMFAHGFTYSGHPVSSAVALENLRIIIDDDVLGHVREVSPRLQDGIRERFADHPLIGEIRGIGLVGAVEMVKDKATKEELPAKLQAGYYAVNAGIRHGVILRALGNSIAFSPPLIITADEIDQMLDRFGLALDETYAWLQRSGQVA